MRRTHTAAFTLLELLVAATITLILAGLMLAVVTNTLNLWQRTQNTFATSAQASLTLDMLERDLQAAAFQRDGNTWMALDVTNAPSTLVPHGWLTTASMKPSTIESQRLVPDSSGSATPSIFDARFGLSGVWLRFVTTNVESDGSLPVAVSYQLARRPVSGALTTANPADIRYTLFRSAISTAGTFSAGYDVTAVSYGSSTVTPAATRNLRTLTNPSSTDALATNVVDFGVWLYVHDDVTGGLRRIFPADSGDLSHGAHEVNAGPDGNRFPEVADVMVRILSDQGAALLAELESGVGRLIRPSSYASDAEWWWGIVETHSRVYFRRIALKRNPP